MLANEYVISRPPFVVHLGKSALAGLQKLLPRPVYAIVFAGAFASYRALLRACYARKWVSATVQLDRRARSKASIIRRIMPYSLVGAGGLEHTYDAVRLVQEQEIPGDLVELGVARGGCAALMMLALGDAGPQRRVWLFDSFEGLPQPSEEDFEGGVTGWHIRPLPAGSCRGTYEQVEWLLFDKFRLSRESVTLVKGWFQDTLPATAGALGVISVLRIDADWYESVKISLDTLYDRVSPGGVVLIDDYGSCFGARKAVDEFLAARHLRVRLLPDGRGGCHFIKPAA